MQSMLEKVLDTIHRHKMLSAGDKVVIALSGGPDSVALLHVLFSLQQELNISLYALHVNHMLRNEESEGDEAYVAGLCSQLGIPLKICRIDVGSVAREKGLSLEEAGREIRYCELYKHADDIGANRIAVAHNRNDQAETVLMNIIRGTGLKGLAGIDYIRGKIIRPLLGIDRKEIEEYCSENGLIPRIDSTNLRNDFTRNKIRLDLIPFINKSFNTDITESVFRMSELARTDNDFLETEAERAYSECLVLEDDKCVFMDIGKLKMLHAAVLGRVLRIGACRVLGDVKGIGMVHIEAVEDLIQKGRTGTCTELPRGLRAYIEYGRLKFFKSGGSNEEALLCGIRQSFDTEVTIDGITYIAGTDYALKAEVITGIANIDKYINMGYNSLVQFFDYDKLRRGIHIRSRQNGDVFKPLNSNGTKKLKEYFIDNKIPREKRDSIPLVACDKEIVWVIGYKISDKFKVTENTKTVLKLQFFDRRKNVH